MGDDLRWKALMALGLAVPALPGQAATKPVPTVCNAQVNQSFLRFVADHSNAEADQDNVMVCGTMLRSSYSQHAGHSGHGAHQVLVLTAPTDKGPLTVEVVTNDALDGKVTANQGDLVMAYGQAFSDARPLRAGGFLAAAGLHEPHCATHMGADDGWVVVAGKRYPSGSCQVSR